MQTFFENNWITSAFENDARIISQKSVMWRIDEATIFKEASIGPMIDAVRRMPLGAAPWVSLSGGVDSQAACLLMHQAGINFEIAILEFNDGFNSMDTSSAIEFCDEHGFKYNIFKLDILNFLTRELNTYVTRYECPSPQFSAHFKFFETLMAAKSPTSIICGGNTPFMQGGNWVFNTSRSQNAWTVFSQRNNQPMIGNFLCWSQDIAFPLMMSTDDIPILKNPEVDRYEAKVQGMHRLGIEVTPQEMKFNGFEKLKEYFKELSGDGWAFEKMFRHPNLKFVDEYVGVLDLSATLDAKLKQLYFDNRKLFAA